MAIATLTIEIDGLTNKQLKGVQTTVEGLIEKQYPDANVDTTDIDTDEDDNE